MVWGLYIVNISRNMHESPILGQQSKSVSQPRSCGGQEDAPLSGKF